MLECLISWSTGTVLSSKGFRSGTRAWIRSTFQVDHATVGGFTAASNTFGITSLLVIYQRGGEVVREDLGEEATAVPTQGAVPTQETPGQSDRDTGSERHG
jgi:hypothetical protein